MAPRSHKRNGGPCYRCHLNSVEVNDLASARRGRRRSRSRTPPVIHMGIPGSPSPRPRQRSTTPPPPVIRMGIPRSPSPAPVKKIKPEPISSATMRHEHVNVARPWRFSPPPPLANDPEPPANNRTSHSKNADNLATDANNPSTNSRESVMHESDARVLEILKELGR